MSEAVAKLLFVGDIHLGRRPAGAVERLLEHGLSPSSLGPTRAFETAVKLAIDQKVDAVVLAGDVVESERDRFEAYGHLESGTRRLVQAGIRVFGVAGNHDAIALPRLARRIPGFELIGESGDWAIHTLETRAGLELQLVGWSFTKNQCFDNPFRHPSWAKVEAQLRASAHPVLGVLHADLDVTGSPYAPIEMRDLEAAPTDAFFLGHVHQPGALRTTRPIGYLGSLVGLDPGEPGARGPWLVSVRDRGRIEVSQHPVGPIRFERVPVSVEDLDPSEPLDQLHERVFEAFAELRTQLRTELEPHVRAVGCRIELMGRSAMRPAITRFIDQCQARPPVRELEAVFFFVEKIVDETAAAIDVESLEASQSPLGLLANELRQLESKSAPASSLVRSLEREIEAVLAKSWRHLPGASSPHDARALLRRSALRLLGEMVDANEHRGEAENPR